MTHITPIRTDGSNVFSAYAMTERLPEIIREVQALNDYPTVINQRLDALHASLTSNAVMPLPQLPAPDADLWLMNFAQRRGERWLDTYWFFAETYFFRQLVDAVLYWQTWRDPYRRIKERELIDSTRDSVLSGLNAAGTPQDRLHNLLQRALWGNRADLSHPEAMSFGHDVGAEDLIIDEREAAIRALMQREGTVHIIADNFGNELANDLVLIDFLAGQQIPVHLHLKMHPTYVSDATVQDVHWLLNWFAEVHSSTAALTERLYTAMGKGLLRLAPDFYWNSSRFLNDMPLRIVDLFDDARLIILKGDANYRRAFNDTVYPVDTPPSTVIDYLNAPLLALRTLKSDPLVGFDMAQAEALKAKDPRWRVNGKRGIMQFVDVASD